MALAEPTTGDVDDALEGLVHQFADPLAFLRELVQNAIDAGTSEIAISCEFEAGAGDVGVTTIEVADNGSGMTREIIESKLTRLFASSKDGDRTKIGKFGIGFVSVFAIEPDAVCVDTSREGEHWRVLFGRDRTFDLRRLSEPVEGTRVRVIKATTRAQHADLRERVPATVRRWCRHTSCDIRVAGVPMNEPFDLLDAPCRVKTSDGVATIVVGHPRDGHAFFGFYNAGLTLLEGDDRFFPAIACKASSPQLEHTLTRDKVIEDAGYNRVVSTMRALVHTDLARLAPAMLAVALTRPCADDLLDYLCNAVLWHLHHTPDGLHTVWRMEVFHSPSGRTLSMGDCAGRHRGGELLVAGARSPLTDALEREGRTVVLARRESVVGLLRALARTDVCVADVCEHWCMATPASGPLRDAGAHVLTNAVRELLSACGGKLSDVVLGRFAAEASPAARFVAITQRCPDRPTPIRVARTLGTWWLARSRLLVINEDHPIVAELVGLAWSRPAFAAYLLVKSFWLGERLDPRLDGELARSALELSD